MVDLQATRERFRATGRTFPGWARANGLDPAKFPVKMRGTVRLTAEDIEALRADGLLVEIEEPEARQAA